MNYHLQQLCFRVKPSTATILQTLVDNPDQIELSHRLVLGDGPASKSEIARYALHLGLRLMRKTNPPTTTEH